MDEKRDFSEPLESDGTDRAKPQKNSSVQQEALKKTAGLAGFGIALSFLLYCLVAIFNLGKSPSEQSPQEKHVSALDADQTTESTDTVTPRKGRLTAITYSADKPSAVVDFKILHEGDVLHGVEVVKIEKDRVHFQKSRKKWEQRVGETPPTYWE